jgi:hypothetical protein
MLHRPARNSRTARYRARLKAGQRIAPTPVTNEIVELLIVTGCLAIEVSEDRRAIGEALPTCWRHASRARGLV